MSSASATSCPPLPSPTLSILVLAALLPGCSDAPEPTQPPPPLVVAIEAKPQTVPNIVELPGRIEAVRTAEVRARVDGIVQRRLYEEGSDVREGTPLFQIDPREKRAQLQQAEAALRRMMATRANAAQIVARYTPLVNRRAVSAQEYDSAVADLQQAEADVAQAEAAVDNAKLELSYTMVRSPLTGRVGAANVTEGALVSAASATLMTRVDQLAPIYATFTQSSAEIMNLRQRLESGTLRLPALDRIQVKLILESGIEYGPVGHLDFASLSVDPSTGSQMLRARFPNDRRILLPGQFVRGRIFAGEVPSGISIPQRAVAISNEEANVMLVGTNSTAVARPVELGSLIEGNWIIRSGISPGDRVIVEGWQKVQPGQKVRVKAPGQTQDSAKPAPQSSPNL